MLQRLPLGLSKVNTDNISEILFNEMQIVAH